MSRDNKRVDAGRAQENFPGSNMPEESEAQFTQVLVDDSGLHTLNARPPLGKYLRQLHERRYFIRAQARAQSFQTGRGMYLGRIWILLDPIIKVAVYAVVFGLILQVSRGMDNFIGFLTIGVIFFGFITTGISGGNKLIQRSKSLIGAFSFPKATLVIAKSYKAFLDHIPVAAVGIVGALLFQLGKPIGWEILMVFPVYLLVHIFGMGATFIGARLTAFIPDFSSLVNVINRALFFMSGVFFPLERFATIPVLREIMLLNPVYHYLEVARLAVLESAIAPWSSWAYITAWSLGILILGFLFFWRAEAKYASVR